MFTRSRIVPQLWRPIGSIWVYLIEKSPNSTPIRAFFNTNKNCAPSEQFLRVGELFAAPWSSKLLATMGLDDRQSIDTKTYLLHPALAFLPGPGQKITLTLQDTDVPRKVLRGFGQLLSFEAFFG